MCEAVQEVAPPHARPRSRSARIGSVCDVVAAPVWVQAWVGAVGRVRNASPIREDPVWHNCRICPRFLQELCKPSLTSKRVLRFRHPASIVPPNKRPTSGANPIRKVSSVIQFRFSPSCACYSQLHPGTASHMSKKGFQPKNKHGEARWADRLSSGDAGAPAPTPRSPRARRFRRNRSL